MPDPRLYARQYSEDEIRAMPDGMLLRWLAEQVRSEVKEFGDGWHDWACGPFGWDDTYPKPNTLTPTTDLPDTAEYLAAMAIGDSFACVQRRNDGTWMCSWTAYNPRNDYTEAPTPGLAILRAAALLARQRQAAK
jgi:hypothetical protein